MGRQRERAEPGPLDEGRVAVQRRVVVDRRRDARLREGVAKAVAGVELHAEALPAVVGGIARQRQGQLGEGFEITQRDVAPAGEHVRHARELGPQDGGLHGVEPEVVA